MLRHYFDGLANQHTVVISETLTQAYIKWKVSADVAAGLSGAIQSLSLISTRDTYELVVDGGEAVLSLTNKSVPYDVETEESISDLSNVDEAEFNLTIRKNVVDSQISVYFLDRLALYFSTASFTSVLATIATLLQERLEFNVHENISPFSSDTISFSVVGSRRCPGHKASRSERLQAFVDNTSTRGIPVGILPSDFLLNGRSQYATINAFFDQATAVLALAFLANASELDEQSRFSYRIYGYKSVICSDIAPATVAKFYELIHKVYFWAYEGGSAADKLGLVRNVLSINLDDSGCPRFDEALWEAVRSNYQIYLKGNIQSYLEVTNKINELLLDSVARTSQLADDMMDSFKNNVFIVVTFLLTVVVINGLKDTGPVTIFSTTYLLIVLFLAISSTAWLILIRRDTWFRYNSATQAMQESLIANYRRFLIPSEINTSVNPTLTRNRIYLQAQIRKYSWWWGGMIFLFVVFFALGNIYFIQLGPLAWPSDDCLWTGASVFPQFT